jgi:hypothetical protein
VNGEGTDWRAIVLEDIPRSRFMIEANSSTVSGPSDIRNRSDSSRWELDPVELSANE